MKKIAYSAAFAIILCFSSTAAFAGPAPVQCGYCFAPTGTDPNPGSFSAVAYIRIALSVLGY